MSSKPPFDMITTKSPSLLSRDTVVTMSSVFGMKRASTPDALRSADQLLGRQPLGVWQRRPEDGGQDDPVCRRQRPREIGLKHAAARCRRSRLEDRPNPPVRIRRTHTRERLADRRRVMREIVVHGDAPHGSPVLHPPPHALESLQRCRHRVGAEPDGGADGNGGERVAHVEGAEERQLERCGRHARPTHAKRSRRAGHGEIVRLPVRPVRQSERLDAAMGQRPQGQRVRVVGTEQQKATARDEIHESLEREADGAQVGVDIRVIELDIADDGDVGQVFEELRGLVEERAVVLVALDDELAAAADSISCRRSSRRCRRRACSGQPRRRPAATRSTRSSSSCRACR